MMMAALARLLAGRSGTANTLAIDQALEGASSAATAPPDTPRPLRHRRAAGPPQAPAPASPHAAATPGSTEGDRVRKARQFLEERASGQVSLKEVADHVGWSKWHCARMFKRHT